MRRWIDGRSALAKSALISGRQQRSRAIIRRLTPERNAGQLIDPNVDAYRCSVFVLIRPTRSCNLRSKGGLGEPRPSAPVKVFDRKGVSPFMGWSEPINGK